MKQDPNSTGELIRAARQDDRAARERLFTRYLPVVRQIVALRLGYRLRQFADLEDVVQECLLRLLRDLSRFEQRSEGSFRNWLSKCVESEIADIARKAAAQKRGRGRVVRLSESDTGFIAASMMPDRGPRPSEVVRASELSEKIEQALLELPEQYREVIILRNLCGMSFAEIIKLKGYSQEVAARMALSRGLRQLKEKLGMETPTPLPRDART